MGWRKWGRIFVPSGSMSWMTSHASTPFAEHVEADLFRIYFSPRDAANRSHVGWLELEITRPERVLRLAETPLLQPGRKGSHDAAGAMMSWAITVEEKRHIYYIGWNVREDVPFHPAIGIASGPAGGAPIVDRIEPGPTLERSISDPFFCSNPCVLKDATGWRMWYLSGLGWSEIGGRLSPSYHVRHARSADGLFWTPIKGVAIPLQGECEYAIARPSVLPDRGILHMWFCVRGRTTPYRLGYATSKDGRSWSRKRGPDNLIVSENGWDAEMIAYPHVFEHRGVKYMLYCGNGFGRSGFGLAIWE